MHANQLSPLFPCPQPSRWPSQSKRPLKYLRTDSPYLCSTHTESLQGVDSHQAYDAYALSHNVVPQSINGFAHWHVATPNSRIQVKPDLSSMASPISSHGLKLDFNGSTNVVWPKFEFPYGGNMLQTIRPDDLLRPSAATRSNSQEPSVSSSCEASEAMQMDDMDGVEGWTGRPEGSSSLTVGRVNDLAGVGYHEPCQLALSPEPMGGSSSHKMPPGPRSFAVVRPNPKKIKQEDDCRDPWIERQQHDERAESVSETTDSIIDREDEHDPNKWCPLCEKTFSRAFNYRSHMATHNPNRERSHICRRRGCNKAFYRPTDLKRHEQSVHLKLKEWRCKQCNSSFPRKDSLTRHQTDGCVQQKKMVVKQEPSQAGLSRRFQNLQVQRTSYPDNVRRPQEDEYFTQPSVDLPRTRSRT